MFQNVFSFCVKKTVFILCLNFIFENDGFIRFLLTPFVFSIVLLFWTHVFSCSIVLFVLFFFFCSLEAIKENNF